MGWFWAENDAPARTMPAHHSVPNSSRLPPPECPMHKNPETVIRSPKAPESACPYTPPDAPTSKASSHPRSKRSKYNPLNYMFSDLSQESAASQKVILDTEREPSTIPRGEGNLNWEYPSPQQMYNALLRKGFHDTNPEDVTSMVSVHNFLNEGAWKEIQTHEGIFVHGLIEGWRTCAKGEEGIEKMGTEITEAADPKLMRFQGRPKDMTPKALMWRIAGWAWPAKFDSAPPFDRHDWYVERKDAFGPGSKQVRYVIDYYAAPDDEEGNPVFFLDVRPSIDRPTQAVERIIRWTGDVWWRAKGGEFAGTDSFSLRKKAEKEP